jgi:polysaccharide export outer membrane protein
MRRAAALTPTLAWLFVATATTAAVLAGCGPHIPDYDYAREPNPRQTEFQIGVSDRLQITVWQNANLSTAVTVRPDGTITLPLLGDLSAVGRTPTALREDIQERLKAFVKDETAVVTVAVTEVNSYRFTVSGEVTRPGVFNADHYVSVIEALALAGGFTRFAKRDRILIVRRDGKGHSRQIPISFPAIANGQHEDMNLVLLAGDTILVP